MILNFSVFLTNCNGAPNVSESILALNFGNIALAAFVHGEILNYHPETVYAETDIKSVKSVSGRNHSRILSFPMTMFLLSFQNESPVELSVVIERSVQQFIQPVAPNNALEILMKASRPTVCRYASRWELSDVIHFQTGYESAPNKSDYLKSITKENKPNIDEQFDAFAANFLNEIVLGF